MGSPSSVRLEAQRSECPPTLTLDSLSSEAVGGHDLEDSPVAIAPIVAAVVVGLIIGRLRRGRITSVIRTKLRLQALFLIAFGCGLAVDVIDLPNPGVWAIVGLSAGLVFAVRNLHLVGMVVIAVGITANLLPVAFTGSTPVRSSALVEAGMVAEADLDRVNLSGARSLVDDDSTWVMFGDTIPVAAADQVISFGDLIVLIGLVSVVANLMLQRRPRRVPASALPSLEVFGWRETSAGEGAIIELATELRPVDEPTERRLVGASARPMPSPVQV